MALKRVLSLIAASSLLLSCGTAPFRPPAGEKYVIVTADDYGVSKNVSDGIAFAAQEGAISEISAMGNFPASLDGLASLSARCPTVGIGVHLNLTTGRPVLRPEEASSFTGAAGEFLSVEDFYARLRTISQPELERELRAQINAVLKKGIPIDHLSDHNGLLTLYPPFFEILEKLAVEYRVALRSPITASAVYGELFPDSKTRRRGMEIAFGVASRNLPEAIGMIPNTGPDAMRAKAVRLDALGIPHPDILVDYLYGKPTLANAFYILRNLPAAVSEIVVHLGNGFRESSYPTGLDTGYFEDREQELSVITSAYLREYAGSLGIHIIRFSDLGRIVR